MQIFESDSAIVAQAPAKLNLFFEVLGKRSDGFHEIEMLVYPINLYDTLYFERQPGPRVELRCIDSSRRRTGTETVLGPVPSGQENLAHKAVDLLRCRAGVSEGARIRLVKRIPSAAGLGGGSSDAAAALAAANRCWNLGWTIDRLQSLGAELGSDVPLFFQPGPSICRGRGERVERTFGLGNLHFVLVRPPVGLSTARVYGECQVPRSPRQPVDLLRRLTAGRIGEAGRLLFNRLEPAAERLCPWIERLRRELASCDCPGYLMSGSGTCCFGLCYHAKHARQVAARLGGRRIGVATAVHGCR